MKKANSSKCFKSIIFFSSWQQGHNVWENAEKIMLNVRKDDICHGSIYFFIFFVWQQRGSNPQPLSSSVNHYLEFHCNHLNFAPVSSKESLDIQATVKCRFTQKRVHDMIITYNHIFVFKLLFTYLNYQCVMK